MASNGNGLNLKWYQITTDWISVKSWWARAKVVPICDSLGLSYNKIRMGWILSTTEQQSREDQNGTGWWMEYCWIMECTHFIAQITKQSSLKAKKDGNKEYLMWWVWPRFRALAGVAWADHQARSYMSTASVCFAQLFSSKQNWHIPRRGKKKRV